MILGNNIMLKINYEILAVAVFINNHRRIQNPVKYLKWSAFWKQLKGSLNCFRKTLHLRCLAGFWEYASYQWLHISTLHKYLGRQVWGFWYFVLTSYSPCSRCSTEVPWTSAQWDNIRCIATWLAGLKYLVV